MNKIENRRNNAKLRLENSLKKGTKLHKYDVVPLLPVDVIRIKQEIANIKAK